MAYRVKAIRVVPTTLTRRVVKKKRYRVVDSSKGLWAPIETKEFGSWEGALEWCLFHGYDLIEEVD